MLDATVTLWGYEILWLDIIGTALGLLYLWLEYKANVWLWPVGVVMPIVHGYVYLARGLYADFALEFYYVAAAAYGWAVWSLGRRGKAADDSPIVHGTTRQFAAMAVATLVLWGIIRWLLVTFTDSTVPTLDALTTALSVVAMWALAHKIVEQWLLWLVVDAISAGLYVYKQIPFTASLYGLYTIMAVAGYLRWKRLASRPNIFS